MSAAAEERPLELGLTAAELREAWPILSTEERLEGLSLLRHAEAEALFVGMPTGDQAALVLAAPTELRRSYVRMLRPDDAADLLQEAPLEDRAGLLALLDEPSRREVAALLAYAEDDAGGLMSPRYARLRPEMSIDEAISYLRRQTREHIESVYYLYVLDADQHLLGVVSFRDLLSSASDKRVRDIMRTDVVTAPEDMDQEALSRLFQQHDFLAVPVVDAENRIKGIVTVDDIVDVVQEEATEDIQKLGGMTALDRPYLDTGFWTMLRKRAGWLSVLFLGELLTASAMGYFEHEIAKAVVLALFVPLIISSGGNSGSQASTLVVRALALGELTLRDWWRVIRRELAAGLVLGCILAAVGFTRIVLWQGAFQMYGDHYLLIASTVGASLVGVVLLGTLVGATLPLFFERLGFDPASASAPFVATFVDVAGLVIYFTVASLVLSGTLL
ncbi:MAG: magnesium transporter [bacterium]|nr:magnesium transporter [bacterium]